MGNNTKINPLVLFVIGTVIMIAGVTLILVWWADVAQLFRGGIGMLLGVVGLFILYNIKK